MKKTSRMQIAGAFVLCVLSIVYVKYAHQARGTIDLASQEKSTSDGYCIALRGNGELEPAHWGALARTVEQLGLPTAMAGGSSATLSMFLLDAMASHPLVENQPIQIQKERASFLLKSLLGFFSEIQKTDSWKDIQTLIGKYQKGKQGSDWKDIGDQIDQGDMVKAIDTLNTAIAIGLVDPQSAEPLMAALQKADRPRAKFYYDEFLESMKVFGKFDAGGDDNLFFRAGILSFESVAVSFGKMASFYSAMQADPEQLARWQSFFDMCAKSSENQSWLEIVHRQPACANNFHELFKAHFDNKKISAHPEEQNIGKHIAVFPGTTVLVGSAAKEFLEARSEYHKNLDHHFGKNFHPSNPSEVRFGYWGNPTALKKIANKLDLTDEKSRRFLALGDSTWKNVMSLSPAEPGLSPLKEFSAGNENYVSAGGWSDLHPVLVLEAAGCEQVVYLTRTGGESLFAQGVAKRLMSLDRDWALLRGGKEIDKLNDEGDPSDQTSIWSKLYNLGNPNSSYNRSLKSADAVLCTNWNAFDVKKELVPLIEDSYRSSFWINPDKHSPELAGLNPVLTDKKSGCSP